MGHEELAANLFRATQTEAKMRRENIKGKEAANKTHFEVGAAVRQTIKDLGGTMPEDLPTPDKSIQQLEREHKKQLKEKNWTISDMEMVQIKKPPREAVIDVFIKMAHFIKTDLLTL